MNKVARENAIYDRLRGKDHLLPVFSSVTQIPERLQEYNPDLFAVFNAAKQKYEVHSLANKGDTFCMRVGFNELDSRILVSVRQGDLRYRAKAFFEEIDRHNDKIEVGQERKRHNDLMGVVEEMHPYFRDYAWY